MPRNGGSLQRFCKTYSKMSNLRFVLDTNMMISAMLLPSSTVRLAFDRATSQGTILLSDEISSELDRIIHKSKFDKYILESERVEFLSSLIQNSSLIEVSANISACRDPEDDKFLELAVSGAATAIVSGDQDLVVLNPFRGIPILTPRQFLEAQFDEGD